MYIVGKTNILQNLKEEFIKRNCHFQGAKLL